MTAEETGRSAAQTILPGRSPFTVVDLLRFPGDGNRYELFDGCLLVSPPSAPVHQRAITRLLRVPEDAGPPVLQPLFGVGLRIGETDFLVPDLVVVPSELLDDTARPMLGPEDVVLAVEVVSVHTRRRDRVMKPSVYADARIPLYWRVELDEGPVIYVYELAEGGYNLLRKHEAGQTVTITVPFEVSFDPAVLLRPRG